MKLVKIISFLLIFEMLTCIVASAECGSNWYIVKKGNSTPGFPDDAAFIAEHNGIFVDTACIDKGEKKLYLTFDAGYENGNVAKILDILKDECIEGAFFILNNLIDKNPELVRRMANEGHLVCNHTANHKDMTTLTNDEMLANLARLESKYRDCTGLEMAKIFRFPEGRYSKEKILLCESAGYKTVFWSMAYDDWDNARQPSSASAIKKLLATTHNGAIILLHPTSSTNVEVLPVLIKTWKQQGYTFGSLSDL